MKTNQIILLIASAIIGVLLFYAGCRCERSRNPIATSRIDTIIRIDSFQKGYPYPVPYKVEVPVPGKPYPVIEWEHDTLPRLIVKEVEKVDTPKILSRFFEKKFYKTSTGLKNGFVISYDTVSQNMITGKGVKGFLFDTLIKETTVIQQPKKVIIYLGAGAFGNRYNLVKGLWSDLSLKTSNDMMYEAGIVYMSDTLFRKRGNIHYKVGVKVPIRNPFRKK